MGITKHQLAGLIGALGAIFSFRASIAIPTIGKFIEGYPLIILIFGVMLIIFSGTIAGWIVK